MITASEYLKQREQKTPHGPGPKKIDPETYNFTQELLAKTERVILGGTQYEQ